MISALLVLVLSQSTMNMNSRYTGAEQLTRPAPGFDSLFGQQRVVQPLSLGDNVLFYGIEDFVWGTSMDAGSVTWLSQEAAVRLTANADGGVAEMRTHARYRYQAGRAQTILQNVVPSTPADNTTQEWGYNDDNDGVFWRLKTDGGLMLVVRSSIDGGVSETVHYVDAGTSNTIEGKTHVYEMRFQWLGAGKLVGLIDGEQVVQVKHSNSKSEAYMRTAVLPLTYKAYTTQGGSDISLKNICSSVVSEGGGDQLSISFSARRGADLTVNSGVTDRPIVAIRPKSTINGVPNHGVLLPVRAWCLSDSRRVRADVHVGATLTGASWTSVASDSIAEFDVAATAYTGGTHVASFAVPADSSGEVNLNGGGHAFSRLGRAARVRAYSGLQEIIMIEVSNLTPGSAVVNCSIDWVEVK